MKIHCELWRDEIGREDCLLNALLQIRARGRKWAQPKQSYDSVTLTLQDHELKLRCFDVRTIVEVTLPCVNGLPRGQRGEAQTITVPASLLSFWSELTERSVGLEFETLPNYPNGLQCSNLGVTSGEGSVQLPILQDDLPTLSAPHFDEKQTVSLPSAQFARILDKPRRSIATESGNFNTDCLVLDHGANSGMIHIIGTDRHQLVWLQEPWQNDPRNFRFAIPRMLLTPSGASLVDSLLAADELVELATSGKWLRLKAGLLTVWHNHLELELECKDQPVYPKYQALRQTIQTCKPVCTVEVDSSLLRHALAQIQCFSHKGTPIISTYLQPNAEGLAVKTSAVETLTSGRQLPGHVSGASVTICVNPQLLLNLCQNWPDEKLQLVFYSNERPLEVRPTVSVSDGLLCCVMPLTGELDW